MGGGKKGKQQAKKAKPKRGSGNPAKRAKGPAQPAEAAPGELPAAFGGQLGNSNFELPDAFKNLIDGDEKKK